MSQLTSTPADSLHAELRALIASSRQRLATAVNAELTRLYWTVGQRLNAEVLGGERASYGAQLLDQLGKQLSSEFGRGFESRNLRRMVKFAEASPSAEIVSTLSPRLCECRGFIVRVTGLGQPCLDDLLHVGTIIRVGQFWRCSSKGSVRFERELVTG